MNMLGIALVWCAVQVSLIGLLASGLYILLRRMRPAAAAPAVLTGLVMVVILSLLALSPWPRWKIGRSGNTAQSAAASANMSSPTADDSAEKMLYSSPGPLAGGQFKNSPRPLAGEAPKGYPGVREIRPSSAALSWQALFAELAKPQAAVSTNVWRWPAVVAMLLLGAMICGLAWLVLGVMAVRWQLLRSRPVSDGTLLELVDLLRAKLGCRRPIEIRQCADLATAATVGWLRPVILLPVDWETWTADQRHAVLAHEIAHARSQDFLALLCGQFGLMLHFYHPLMHWLMNRLRLEQELAADAAAASVSGGQRKYLTTIAELALRKQDRPLLWPARTFLPTQNTFLRRIAVLRDSKLRFDRLSPFTRYATIGAVLLCGLLVAGVRGPGGSAPALAEEPKQPVAVIDAEKASDTAQSESIKTFEARLPSGITVELLGVSENPSKNKFWWRPDGSPLAERPYDSLGNVHYSDQLHVPREFAILLHNLPSEPVGTLLEFDPTYDAAGGGKPKLLGKYTGELYVESVSLPNKPTVTVRFAIADGPWTTACESEQSAFIGTSTGGFGFSPAIEKDDGLIITVTHDIIHPDTRVIALDMAGKEHYASSSGGGGAHNFRQITATFSKLALKDVKTFCLQTRPYKWVEFRNVSLRAGQKTDVQVVQLAELNKPATEEKQSQQPKPQRLYPNDIDSEAAGKRALEKYDTNKDGKISGPELDKAPALKSAMETMHTNRGNGITADDIAARIKAWQATKVVLIGSIACNVIRNGKPVEGVEVKFVPDDFLGENMQTATGITGQDGFARMSIPQKSPDDVSGVAPGFYLVEITKPGEDIPAKYNSQTIFGLEIAPDVSLSKPFKPFVFDIGANRATFDKEASRNNLKQLSVAMLMYYDRYKHYPPAAFYFRRGNTPHSWRVALLPLLGQEDLYKQYNLDEPWDSPNNLKVLENMPDVFRNPTDKADSKNAAYFALVGSGTMFEEKDVSESKAGTKLQDVKDGTAHTILLVEAKRDIPWTKPEDIAYDPEKPLPELGGYFDDGFHTVFADGSVHFIPKTISENVMRLLINKADRQRVEVPSEAR